MHGSGDCRDGGLTSRAKTAVSCAAYELVRFDKSDHCLRPECLSDLQFPGDWPGSHYRCVESLVAFLRSQDFCAPFAQIARFVDSSRAPRSLVSPGARRQDTLVFFIFSPFQSSNFGVRFSPFFFAGRGEYCERLCASASRQPKGTQGTAI